MDGDRSPTDSAAGERIDRAVVASASSRSSAIDAAFSAFPEFGDDAPPASAAEHYAEKPSADEQTAEPGKVAAAAPEQGAETPPPDDNTPAPEGQQGQPTSKDALDAPKHWPLDRRTQFASLPDDAKRIILERNKEANVAVTRAQQESAQYRKHHEAVTSLFSDDHRREMQSANLDEIGAVRYLVQQHDALNRDPVGFLKAVIAQTGVKPEQLFGPQAPGQQPQPGAQPPTEAEWEDPAVATLRQQLAKLEQAETSRQRQAQEHSRNEQQRFNHWFGEQCNAFETAIDDEGNPKYPHLAAVMDDVIRLVKTDPAASGILLSRPHEALERAYTQALYLNPEIRQQIIDADYERRQSAADAQHAVRKAQAAATRKGSPGASGQAQASRHMSRDEAIAKAMREAGL
jgi:hypothetical protein